MTKKINVGILFGGKSAEHEVSLRSARNIIDALDKEKYSPVLIGITREGKWLRTDSQLLLNSTASSEVALLPDGHGEIINFSSLGQHQMIDVVFPILHGPFGEDGTVQGLLKLAGIPFVGSGVLGSAVGMDKDVMKRLLRDAGLPIGKFISVMNYDQLTFQTIVDRIGLPFFVKPANLGSSVGVHKVKNEEQFERSIEDAFQYDRKLIIEEFIEGREIECSVLGNDHPIASVPGEIIVMSEFYSYEAKYLNENGARLQIPAELPSTTIKTIQDLALKTFRVLCAEGLARIDFFLKKDGAVFVNEINTIPGFTSISMYPKLWEASGLPYSELIDRLITLAIERHEKERRLKTSHN